MALADMPGARFARLVVVEFAGRCKDGHAKWLVANRRAEKGGG